MQNSLISHYVRIAISPQIGVNAGSGEERTEEGSPHPCFFASPSKLPTLVLHQGSGGVEFVREGCEENPTGAIASCLGEGGRQKTVVCKYTQWPASLCQPEGEGERSDRARGWEAVAASTRAILKSGRGEEGISVRSGKGLQTPKGQKEMRGKRDQREKRGHQGSARESRTVFPGASVG